MCETLSVSESLRKNKCTYIHIFMQSRLRAYVVRISKCMQKGEVSLPEIEPGTLSV